ncbi:MerC mercury resistance protein [Stieleria neptunia]|uniref:MerC mercury resistance protein n=1 Tax=Stieleria neptunia TaxID=2527979 RepID=A0A518HUK6_9BACT|nr:MerC domain-containing protein [Stieleria neptunia]QDV44487.1 MerC mercury resistance protein [Stieleria neptunia]
MSRELSVIEVISAGPTEQSVRSGWSDWAGMVASIGCAIHCAAMPLVIAYLPALGLSFLADEAFHKWMAGGCFAIALTAFIPGLRQHGRLTPVIIGSVGLMVISIAAFGFAGECCAACESGAASIPAGTLDESGKVLDSATTEVCTDDCCPHCASETAAVGPKPVLAGVNVAALPIQSPWVARIVPWMTPLGGIVLVIAHLLNRRYGCLCGCCDKPESSG